ncbi:MAG: hypothetical protein HXY50_07590 [Ignavibacteriaceae bacterium]|nr:hypothetical protein [Ignavibacteriaceae bacterium]
MIFTADISIYYRENLILSLPMLNDIKRIYSENYQIDRFERFDDEVYKSKIETNFEIGVGIELYRKMFSVNLGLPIILNRNISLVPELSFISAPIISGSVRYKIRLSKLLDINIQGGFGYIPGFPFSFVDASCGILAFNGQYKWGKKISLVLQLKSVFIQNTIKTNTLSIEGYDIIRNPPTCLIIGVSF